MWKDPTYLENKIPKDSKIPVRANFHVHKPDEWLGETAEITWKQFYSHWKQKKQWSPQTEDEFYYLASLPMNKYFPSLCDEVSVPIHPKEQKKSGNLWLGNTGQITHVHYDWSTGDPGMDGLHAVILGKKLFKLFDPAKNVNSFKRVKTWGRFHNAEVDSTGLPNITTNPEFLNAEVINIELQQGDILYIPKLWWHYVHTLEPSIAINFWFQHIKSEQLKLNKHWLHIEQILLAIKDMSITHTKMKNVLQFYGLKVTDEQVEYYLNNKIEFMKLSQFIDSWIAGTKSPWMRDLPDSISFASQFKQKVTDWIYSQSQSQSPPL